MEKGCLQTDVEGEKWRELRNKVKEARTLYEQNQASLAKDEELMAENIRLNNLEIIGDLQVDSDRVLDALRAWGYDGDLSSILSASYLEKIQKEGTSRPLSLKIKNQQKKATLQSKGKETIPPAPVSQVNEGAIVPVDETPTFHVDPETLSPPYVSIHRPEDEVRVPPAGGEFELLPRKRRRTTGGEGSGDSREGVRNIPSSSVPEDYFSVGRREDLPDASSVLDLNVAANLGKGMLMPSDIDQLKGLPLDELRNYVTAHVLAVITLLFVSF
jgi:hypothetical protein